MWDRTQVKDDPGQLCPYCKCDWSGLGNLKCSGADDPRCQDPAMPTPPPGPTPPPSPTPPPTPAPTTPGPNAPNSTYTYPPAAFTEAHRGCFHHGSSRDCTDGADCVGQFYPDLTTCLDNWQAWWVATQGGSQPEMPSPVWVLQPGSDKFPCLNLDIASVVRPRRCGGFV